MNITALAPPVGRPRASSLGGGIFKRYYGNFSTGVDRSGSRGVVRTALATVRRAILAARNTIRATDKYWIERTRPFQEVTEELAAIRGGRSSCSVDAGLGCRLSAEIETFVLIGERNLLGSGIGRFYFCNQLSHALYALLKLFCMVGPITFARGAHHAIDLVRAVAQSLCVES